MATYEMIRNNVLNRYGRHVNSCWIAHVKELNGLPLRQAWNRPLGSERKHPCPDWARPLIEDSIRRFGMLE